MSKKEEQDALYASALKYHKEPVPGKVALKATKNMATQRDLALAYSPGCLLYTSDAADE